MKYKITLMTCGGGWIAEASNANGVIVYKWDMPVSKESARANAVQFISKQKDFKSYEDITIETSNFSSLDTAFK